MASAPPTTVHKRRPRFIQRGTLTRAPDSDQSRSTTIPAVPEYRYLVIGGGMTGDAACRGIRDHDDEGTIGLVGSEPHPPYVRPPLTKALWTGKEEDSIWRKTDELGVDVHVGRRIVSVDLDARTATDDAGDTYSYERVLLATGGTPRHLPSAPRRRRLLPDVRHLSAPPRARTGRTSGRGRRRRLHRLRDRGGSDA